ncbi:MAG: zinc-dependent metalloprotease [Mucilaginibacter polytrichastri]|nr:zinc-dependent metalloprotease [Mucilaginibacter polytrichastri]
MRKLYLIVFLLAGSLFHPAFLRAQPKKTEQGTAAAYASKLKDTKKYDGYFPFYWNEKTGQILLEVSRFHQEFLYVNALPYGVGSNDLGLDRGQLGDTRIVRFERSGPKILLVQPNYDYRAVSSNARERRTVEQSFATSVIWGFKAEAIDGDKALIDFTPFLLRDAHGIADKLGAMKQGAYKADETRSAVFLPSTKDFPKNSEFEAIVTFTGSAKGAEIRSVTPDPDAVTVHMHHSFIELPDSSYKPRKFDPRSGFFGITYMDFAAPFTEPAEKRFIRRHRLQKKDPSAAVGEAVKPIVYYVDNGAPEPIRTALLEGASWWNQAFEAAGYKNAFQVKILPDDADPMDIRYNMIQWVHRSSRGWSYGASVTDPRTGEIIKGHVTLGSLRDRQDYLIAEGLLQPYKNGVKTDERLTKMVLARIRQLAVHEVGHTLGLYHNYAASVKDRASVMDYPPPFFTLQNDGSIDLSNAYATGVGGWDKRAIVYGYTDLPDGADEDQVLNGIIRQTISEGYSFISDADARPPGSAHPYAHLWDNGTDAGDELVRLLEVRKSVLGRFSENAIRANAPMATLEEVLVPAYLMHRFQIEAASKVVGGLFYTYAVKCDGQVSTRMIDPQLQWRALRALLATIAPENLTLPEELIAKIPPRPVGYPRTRETFGSATGVTFDPLSAAGSVASTTLQFVLNPERLARLIEHHARDKNQPSAEDVLDAVLTATWYAPKNSGLKAELQNSVTLLLVNQMLSLLASADCPPLVKVVINKKIDELALSGARKPNELYALQLIRDFRDDPSRFTPAPVPVMPDGPPIGMDLSCGLTE